MHYHNVRYYYIMKPYRVIFNVNLRIYYSILYRLKLKLKIVIINRFLDIVICVHKKVSILLAIGYCL